MRTGTDKSDPLYRYLDDKWLFTRRYFELAAARAGFASVRILPDANHATQYRDYITTLLGLGGVGDIALPGWAWNIVDVFDTSLSPEMKWDVPL